ncbi:MAG: hypothetical protein R6X20_17970 [Phycisphaerae bacterium]
MDPDGTFEVVVPQGSTVMFYRHYNVHTPGAAYEVPPQTVQVPLGCAEKEVRLRATAVELMPLRGRVVDEATGEPLAGFVVSLEYWPPGLPPPYHPRGYDPYKHRPDASGDAAGVAPTPHPPGPRRARIKARRPRGPEYARPAQSVSRATCVKEGRFSFVVPRSKDAVFFLSVRPPKPFPDAAHWKRTHPRRAVQIDDITAYEGRPYVWKIPSRTPSLILEYRTVAGNPLPLPEDKGRPCIRGWLHEIVDPATTRDRVETTPEGHKVEYDYSKSLSHDGLPIWSLDKETTFRKDGQRHTQGEYNVPVTTIQYSLIQRDSKGRSIQMFFELDEPANYAVVLHPDDTAYRPMPEDKIIKFKPKQGETVRKTIHVERKEAPATPEP